jgi:RimJ/RimL family protein N-acetyltransferase
MKHDITIGKFGITLRPVEIEDADFIFKLRTDPDNSQFIGDTNSDISKQYQWIENYFEQENDYYFIIESNSKEKLGTIGIYDIINGSGEWGRWIISKKHPVAPASAWLIYEIAFNILNLKEVYCRTVVDNKSVVSFHERCGLHRVRVEKDGVAIKGENKDLIIQMLSLKNYKMVQKKLEVLASFSERLMLRKGE